MGEISVGTLTVRDMGLGEYDQRYWIFRDDNGARDINSGPGACPRPRQSRQLKSHRKDPARKYLPLGDSH
jgi:hypothetical protein